MWFRTLLIALFSVAGFLDVYGMFKYKWKYTHVSQYIMDTGAALLNFALAYGTYAFWTV